MECYDTFLGKCLLFFEINWKLEEMTEITHYQESGSSAKMRA